MGQDTRVRGGANHASDNLLRGGFLDALRFFAAFLIVLYHYGFDAPISLDRLSPVFDRGYLATDFFLMLSGYVLARAFGERIASGAMRWKDFFVRRVARLWPAQLIILAGFISVLLAARAAGVSPRTVEHFPWSALPGQALLIQAWGLPEQKGWNFASWSISALIACYAAFPFLWRLQGRARSSWLMLAMAVMVLLGIDLACRGMLGRPVYDLPSHLGVLRASGFFIVGMALARVAEEAPLSAMTAKVVLLAGMATLVVAQAFGRQDFASMAAIAALILAAGSRPVVRPSRLTVYGARLSFSLFITHLFTAMLWYGGVHMVQDRMALPVALEWLLWGMGLPLAVAAAYLFDRFIDVPSQAWIRRRLKGRLAALAPKPAYAASEALAD